MGSDPQSYLQAQYAPIARLRAALADRARVCHEMSQLLTGLTTISNASITTTNLHNDPYVTCTAAGCREAREALEATK